MYCTILHVIWWTVVHYTVLTLQWSYCMPRLLYCNHTVPYTSVYILQIVRYSTILHCLLVLCTDAVIALCCTIVLCYTCCNQDFTMMRSMLFCTALLYMSMNVMRRCDVDLGGCRVDLIGDTDVTNSTIPLPPWWHQSYMKARIAIKSHNQINMSNQLPYPHPHPPPHMMAMNRARNVRKSLCKEMRSARKRLRLGQSFRCCWVNP